ncbi:LacI family transcriptional regulator [Neobacillus pocheonensis]|uniref:LacI family transcriptional regulator n=1 Tax=Neobacillus pocheonensis TaxID=363869 RepID=A0ABT0WB46_9BACI|nr:LacI family transcriptional regulator [Neobacillus pocheonensis]
MSSINEVAKMAGVSKSTVSNVFSQKRPISKEVSERVLQAARELNYKPNYLARSLAVKQTRIIGINMPGERAKFSQFHLSLLNGVLSECYEKGYRLLVNTLSAAFKEKVEFIASDPVDGEIILDPTEENDKRVEDRINQGVPFVIVGKPPKIFETAISYVDNDNFAIGTQVTNYLLSLGHERILFLNAPEYRTVSRERYQGYKYALTSVGLVNDSWLVSFLDESKTSAQFGYEQTKAVLDSGSNVTAIITDSNKMASGVYRAAKELEYRIPDDLSVISFSNESTYANILTPPLTCIDLNAELLGREAAKLLLEKLEDKNSIVKRIIIPSEFIERGSCKKANK